MSYGINVERVTDALAICSEIFESAKNEIVYLAPPSVLVLASQLGLNEEARIFVQNGGRVRGIVDFSDLYIEVIRKSLGGGENVRYFRQYKGIFMLVGDAKESISSVNVDAEGLSMDTPITALWSDDPTYIEYLISTFEGAWKQAVPAAQRIEELLKEGAPSIN